MYNNPYSSEYNNLKKLYDKTLLEKEELLSELNWHNQLDIRSLKNLIQSKIEEVKKIDSIIKNIETQINDLEFELNLYQYKINSLFNPFNWFDKEQKTFRDKEKNIRSKLQKYLEKKESKEEELSKIEEQIKHNVEEIKKYENFNKRSKVSDLHKKNEIIPSLEKDLNNITTLKDNFEKRLEPIVTQIEDLKRNLTEYEANLTELQTYEYDLNNAENSYQRKMIHEECEKRFGDAKPRVIINEITKTINKLEKDLIKAEKRANRIYEIASKEIHNIIIDGSNLCYEGSNLIGLNPLIKLTQKLNEKYKVTVVFDSSIRFKLETDDQGIIKHFEKDIKIHVVATRQLADDTILDLASNNITHFVISNDRFGEYKDKEVVLANRIIRHEITDGHIFVHDLGINERFEY